MPVEDRHEKPESERTATEQITDQAEGVSPAEESDPPGGDGGIQWLFFLGLLLFVAGAVAYVADLVTAFPILRSLLVNGLGAVILVLWAGRDSLTDEESSVDSLGGAVGTVLILIGLYLLLVGAIVALTSFINDRFFLGLALVGGGLPLVIGGFFVFPSETLLERERAGTADAAAGPDENQKLPGGTGAQITAAAGEAHDGSSDDLPRESPPESPEGAEADAQAETN